MKPIALALVLLIATLGFSQVGINTTTPDASSILDVTAPDKGMLVPRVPLTNVYLAAPVVSPAASLLVYNTNAALANGQGTGYYYWNGARWIRLSTSADNYWQRDTASGYLFPENLADRIGIQTTAPNAPLSFGSTLGHKISLYEGATGNVGFGVAGNLLKMYSDNSNADIAFGYDTGGALTERVRFLANGNVGIGTSSPNAPLGFPPVLGRKITLYPGASGNMGFGVDTNLLKIHSDQDASDIAFGVEQGAVFYEKVRIKGNGRVGIGTSTPNAPLAFPASLGHKITLYPGASGNAGLGIAGNLLKIYADKPAADVAFGYDASGTFNEQMRVKGSGNVGIGTTAPNAKLEVSNAAASELMISSGAGFGSSRLSMISDRGTANEWRPSYLEDADNGGFTGRLDFYTNGTGSANKSGSVRAMSIVNGSVGIGNTAPAQKLDVTGKIRINDGSQATGRVLISDASGVGTWTANVAITPPVVGVFAGSGATFGTGLTTNVTSANYYCNAYIDLPPGKWLVMGTYLLSGGVGNDAAVFVRTMFSCSAATYTPCDTVGSTLISGTLTGPSNFGIANGQNILYNTSGATRRYYVWANITKYGSVSTAYSINQLCGSWAENMLVAIPMN